MEDVPTRAVDDMAKAVGGAGVSRNQIARRSDEIDAQVYAFLTGPLEVATPQLRRHATRDRAKAAKAGASGGVIASEGLFAASA